MHKIIHSILEIARWAPSGDNAQPWRFEIKNDNRFVIQGHDTRNHCIYDLQGHASQLAIGTLLQNIKIAASKFSLSTSFELRENTPETNITIDVALRDAPDIQPDPLLPFITNRTVNRRALSTRQLTGSEKAQLENSLGQSYRIVWFSSINERFRISRLLFQNGGLRLDIPEAYETHTQAIEWRCFTSEDRIPDRAVGLDPISTYIMRWAMSNKERSLFINQYLGGTLLPRLELDFIPGMACAAHFIVFADTPLMSISDYLEAGMAVQRFWLTATRLDLLLQPEMTPLIFNSYISNNVAFSKSNTCQILAKKLSHNLNRLIVPESARNAVFMGRIGTGRQPRARSVRLPLEKLIVSSKNPAP